jgi:hypothetical protein
MRSIRTQSAVATAAASLVLLAGCGGTSGTSATTYVKDVCTSVGTWEQAIKTHTSALTAALGSGATPAKGKQALASYLDATISETTTAQSGINAAGTPAVKNGSKIASTFKTAFVNAKAALVRARAQVNTISTTDPTAFEASATKLGTEAQTSLSSIGNSLSSLSSSQLDKAAASVPACSQLAS